jgi:hypothetical protein
MTQAGHITPRLIKHFLLTAYALHDPQHAEGLISMDNVGHRMAQKGLLKEEVDKKDRDLLKQIAQLHMRLGHLAQDPNTEEEEEVELFRFTPKGLAMARQWLSSRSMNKPGR